MSTTSFRDLGLDNRIVEAIEDAGYEFATPIQAEGIPVFLRGEDLILQAQTGTGKTAAFALPILNLLGERRAQVEALILAPTRELAGQISREFEQAASSLGIRSCAVYGGAPFDPQVEALREAQVVCATPGRLLDHLRRGTIDLSKLRVFGLDEADEMLSMGFEKEVFDVISFLPEKRQSFLCSATLNEPILRLASNFLDDDADTINMSSDSVGAQSVEHVRFDVSAAEKLAALRRVLHAYCPDGALIFANTRAATFRVTAELQAEGLEVDVLNGELPQKEREKALRRMRDGTVKYLVATDVAARGIDISGLPAVVNYDMPDTPDVYIHRTGRTGRAGQFGIAFSLVTPADISVHHYLGKFYKLKLRPRSLPSIDQLQAIRADQWLARYTDGLDADGTLQYARFLPAARRLREHVDGERTIAKLLAHYAAESTADSAHDADSTDMANDEQRDDGSAAAAREESAPHQDADDQPVEEHDGARSTEAPSSIVPEVDAESPIELAESSGDEVTDEAEDADADADPDHDSTHDRLTAEQVYSWVLENSGSRGRAHIRSAHAVAKALDAHRDDVLALAEEHPGLKRTGRSRPMIRIVDDASEDQAAPSTAPRQAARREAGPRKASPRAGGTSPDVQTIFDEPSDFVAVRIDGADREEDLESLAESLALLAGLEREDLGEISLLKNSHKVEVRDLYWDDFVRAINEDPLGGRQLKAKRLH